MTIEQIRRMACACVGPEYHQTGNARCAISILLFKDEALMKKQSDKAAHCENCGAQYRPGHKCTSPYDAGAGSRAGAEAFRKGK